MKAVGLEDEMVEKGACKALRAEVAIHNDIFNPGFRACQEMAHRQGGSGYGAIGGVVEEQVDGAVGVVLLGKMAEFVGRERLVAR